MATFSGRHPHTHTVSVTVTHEACAVTGAKYSSATSLPTSVSVGSSRP